MFNESASPGSEDSGRPGAWWRQPRISTRPSEDFCQALPINLCNIPSLSQHLPKCCVRSVSPSLMRAGFRSDNGVSPELLRKALEFSSIRHPSVPKHRIETDKNQSFTLLTLLLITCYLSTCAVSPDQVFDKPRDCWRSPLSQPSFSPGLNINEQGQDFRKDYSKKMYFPAFTINELCPSAGRKGEKLFLKGFFTEGLITMPERV